MPVGSDHLNGNRLAWRYADELGVRLRDLVSGQEQTFFAGDSVTGFALAGDWLLGLINEGQYVFLPYGRILARNLVTGQQVEVAGPLFQYFDGVFGSPPSLDGNTVAYTRLLDNSVYPLFFDLVSGQTTRMTYDPQTVALDIQVSGNRIVWQDSREGLPYQIWMHVR